jgi:hypothetical protein
VATRTLVVKGHDGEGNLVSLELPVEVVTDTPPTDPMLVGWSMSDEPHPGVCGVSRIYDWQDNDLATAVNTHKVRRIGLTSKDDTKSGAEVVRRIKDVLRRFPGLEVDYAHENEVDRADHRGGSDASIKAWCAEHKVIQDAIHAAFPADGSQGKVKTAIDLTAYATRQLGVGEKMLVELKRIGALPDVLAASMYPAGRNDNPATESPMADFIDLFVDLAAKYGIGYVSCWEIGTPVSTRYDRPTLVTKWVRRLRDYSAQRGVVARDFIYWDQQKSGGPPNPFKFDGSTPTVQGATQKALLAA